MEFELVVGLEVHVQLNTKSKMFCGCDNDAIGAAPNTLVCPVCFGMPGTLPVANKEAILKTLLVGKALGSALNEQWHFERKNYFYPDLPKGYQITSSTVPPLFGGEIEFRNSPDGIDQSVRIHHVHLEEDAGKLIHGDNGYSYIDLNRAGTPLIELVTEPDLRSALQARLFMQEIQVIMRRIGISKGDMENGHLRCDANVSIRKMGDKQYGTRVEIKNLNSFQSVEKAVAYEFKRQVDLAQSERSPEQETRGWDEHKLITKGHRQKEEIHDYRYMPEPDIPPIIRLKVAEFSDEALDHMLPELPNAFRTRVMSAYDLSSDQAEVCLVDSDFGGLAEGVLRRFGTNKVLLEKARKVLFADVRRVITEQSMVISDIARTEDGVVAIVQALAENRLTHQLFKTALPNFLLGKVNLSDLLIQSEVSTSLDINALVDLVLTEHPTVVHQWQSGDAKVTGFLIGQVMAKSKGQADPRRVSQIMQEALRRLVS